MEKLKSKIDPQWEAHLVRRAAAGEAVAFELLTELHRPALDALARRMLRNSDDSNDAVQDTFLKAYRAIGHFDPRRPLRPWLCRICANCCVDIVRDRRHQRESLDDHEYMLEDPRQNVEEQAEDLFDGEALRRAVRKLPARYRQIVEMRHFGEMEVCEIARLLEKPEGTIKSWLFRARALLKAELEPISASLL